MSAADNFKSASFNGITFPYVDYAVKGSIRHHTHEYPHEPGGVDEPLGRRLYEFSFTCEFDESMHGIFPGLYPNTLTTLFALFEAETVGDLVIPSVGTFSARCTDWDTRKVAKIRSGEKVNFRFLEVIDIIIIDPTESVVQSLPNEAASILTATQALQTAPLGSLPSNAIPTSTDIANAERLVTLVNGLVSAKSANDFAALGASQGVMSFAQKIDAAPYLRYARTFAIVDSLRRVFSGRTTPARICCRRAARS